MSGSNFGNVLYEIARYFREVRDKHSHLHAETANDNIDGEGKNATDKGGGDDWLTSIGTDASAKAVRYSLSSGSVTSCLLSLCVYCWHMGIVSPVGVCLLLPHRHCGGCVVIDTDIAVPQGGVQQSMSAARMSLIVDGSSSTDAKGSRCSTKLNPMYVAQAMHTFCAPFYPGVHHVALVCPIDY